MKTASSVTPCVCSTEDEEVRNVCEDHDDEEDTSAYAVGVDTERLSGDGDHELQVLGEQTVPAVPVPCTRVLHGLLLGPTPRSLFVVEMKFPLVVTWVHVQEDIREVLVVLGANIQGPAPGSLGYLQLDDYSLCVFQ